MKGARTAIVIMKIRVKAPIKKLWFLNTRRRNFIIGVGSRISSAVCWLLINEGIVVIEQKSWGLNKH